MAIRRRVLLGSALTASTAGLAGLAGTAGAATPPRRSGALVLLASGLRIADAGRTVPRTGELRVVTARLLDEATGESGSFYAEYRAVWSPDAVGEGAVTSIQTHHFVLDRGTLVGTGAVSRDDTEQHYAVVAGTGAFAGARGTYLATQHHLGLGGDGSGTYHFALIDPGA